MSFEYSCDGDGRGPQNRRQSHFSSSQKLHTRRHSALFTDNGRLNNVEKPLRREDVVEAAAKSSGR